MYLFLVAKAPEFPEPNAKIPVVAVPTAEPLLLAVVADVAQEFTQPE